LARALCRFKVTDSLLVLFNALLVGVNVILWFVTKKSADAAKEAADVARASSEAAIAFERPYIRISQIKASIRGDVSDKDFFSVNDVFPNTDILRAPDAICIIENYGKTPAFVEKTEAQLRFSADELQIILERGKPIPIVTLKPGESYQFHVPLGEPITQQRAEMIQSRRAILLASFQFCLPGCARQNSPNSGQMEIYL